MELDVERIQDFSSRILENLERVIVGKRDTLELIVTGLLCQGHLLLEDVPGVGKTMVSRALAKSLGCQFSRIQFTPDMLPSDVTGVSIFNQVTRQFEFRPGPLMAQIVLADEINRATPKTQSALLEAMEERQITVDGVTHRLPDPFLVMATQNPIEYEGTFPLPEAQLDRFLMRLRLGYPALADEVHILELQQINHPINDLSEVAPLEEVLQMQEMVKYVYVSPPVKRYIVELVRATRTNTDVYLGSSPRGSLSLVRTAQVRAAINGRDFVLPDDVKGLASFVLAHRIIIDPAARLKNISAETIIQEVLHNVSIPGGNLEKPDRAG
ncbi:AAA family ATPase [Levilinea saccharolytica]|uniref:ATPase AAA n=1 Tax=Levilinea saccharolytica TaxID=229921 RepID=A0A0P6XR94_9CHLR|nr:MoxR family ATPase [Levilinea saccharolytica]KPL85006.1 ATPase AAA [Levilinea saccharolytica]GAP18106.1 MoxR-like ATPases [Levilinea saccharolytica]